MKITNKTTFFVSYAATLPTCLGTSHSELAKVDSVTKSTPFGIIAMRVVESHQTVEKYQNLSATDIRFKDAYVMEDTEGNTWHIQYPFAVNSDFGRSDHVAIRKTGLPGEEYSHAAVEITYHLREFRIATQPANRRVVYVRRNCKKGEVIAITRRQADLIQAFNRQYPDWHIRVENGPAAIGRRESGNFVSTAVFTVVNTTSPNLFSDDPFSGPEASLFN